MRALQAKTVRLFLRLWARKNEFKKKITCKMHEIYSKTAAKIGERGEKTNFFKINLALWNRIYYDRDYEKE